MTEKRKGQISVSSENIFPIIRQWLYAEKDIFLRELVANAADALSKRRQLIELGSCPAAEENLKIELIYSAEKKTIRILDNGIGMTASEIDRYINQIAYSGLLDFVEKYQNAGEAQTPVIGHFGLGFYSAFMVSEPVEIFSRSCLPDSQAAHWLSPDGLSYELTDSERENVGTEVLLHLTEEAAKDYTGERLRAMLEKYCGFMPWPIYFRTEDSGAPERETEQEPVNDTQPLWQRDPKGISDAEYAAFYRKTFKETKDPLFWIHLNLDYPFPLKGILYFPLTDRVYDNLAGRIRVYSRQVYVADNVREMIPDFLFLLQGCLDCPELPLNVSRSYLQDDAYVRNLSGHIVRKLADRLLELFRNERDRFEESWRHISVFFKFGIMRDRKFADKLREILIFRDSLGAFHTLSELGDGPYYYSEDEDHLLSYQYLLQAKNKKVLILDDELDKQLINWLEQDSLGKIRFLRADAGLEAERVDADFIGEPLQKLFSKILGREIKVSLRALGEDALPLMFELGEEGRRLNELRAEWERFVPEAERSVLTEMEAQFPLSETIVINDSSPLPARLASSIGKPSEEARVEKTAAYLLKLAKLAQNELKGEEMRQFLLESGNNIQEMLNI